MWIYNPIDEKRICPMRGKTCYAATFDSYREMLLHCRKDHPDSLPLGGDSTSELVVTDTHGRVLSWEEISQIIDDPTFCEGPPREAQAGPRRRGQPSLFTAALGW